MCGWHVGPFDIEFRTLRIPLVTELTFGGCLGAILEVAQIRMQTSQIRLDPVWYTRSPKTLSTRCRQGLDSDTHKRSLFSLANGFRRVVKNALACVVALDDQNGV